MISIEARTNLLRAADIALFIIGALSGGLLVFSVMRPEEYGGFMDKETTGFVADISLSDFQDQIENGKVVITASLTDEKQNVITERSLSLSIRE